MKFEDISFSLIGGDRRQVELSNYLIDDGYQVKAYAFDKVKVNKKINCSNNLENTIKDSNIILGPIPCSKNNENLFAKYSNETIKLDNIFECIEKNQIFMAGRITNKIQERLIYYDVDYIDLLEIEDMAIRNAVPTAEGAIQYAMENSNITLHSSRCIVLGFGRCGKILAHMLKGIGANTSVGARSWEDGAYIESYCYKFIPLKELSKNIGQFDFIFNTIPSLILDREMLSNLKESCTVIELASAPGGIDFDSARDFGINIVNGQGLPGKVASKTAGKIIFDTILNAYSNMEGVL